MTIRDTFCADWAFSISSAIENFVQRKYPMELRRWPLLDAFAFEGFTVGDSHFVIAMRDKAGIGFATGTGEGVPKPFIHPDHPLLPPTQTNVDEWLSYLYRKFGLRTEDWAMILPIHDSHRSDARADFALFTKDERNLWHYQFNAGISRQIASMNVAPQSPTPPHVTIINVSGNARAYIRSTDSSVNVISTGVEPELFNEMLSKIRATAADTSGRAVVEQAVETLRGEYGKDTFTDSYLKFMAVLADNLAVWGPILAPFLSELTKLVFG